MICLPVTEASQAAQARRVATELARQLGLNELERGKVALIATEVATNLSKHATQGQLLLHSFTKNSVKIVDLLALDKGPGMENVARCLRDGYSTTGSPGTGFGAILRMASVMEVHSIVGVGTAVFARLQSQAPEHIAPSPGFPEVTVAGQMLPVHRAELEIGMVCLPKPGERVCGDAWATDQRPGHFLLVVADGLGHGPHAATASQKAVDVFHTHAAQTPAEIVTKAHAALRATRGAALAVVEINQVQNEVRFCGVGNIASSIFLGEKSHSMASHNGIVGQGAHKIQEFRYPWAADALLVMHSDGLTTRWSLSAYAGLAARHPSLIAGVLYRDFARGRDDVTVVVVKEARTP